MSEVIEILSEYAILIDFGYKEGAEKGDKIQIYKKGREVYNSAKEYLGTLDIIKDELEITKVYEHFSVCKKIFRISKTAQRNPFEINSFASLIKKMEVIKTRTETLPLNVDKEDCTNEIFETDEPIKKGDLVKILKK